MSTPFRLLLPRQLLEEMIAHAYAELPNECCGLLAGTIGADGIARIARRYPLVNARTNPTAYLSMYAAWWSSHGSTDHAPPGPMEYLSDPQSMFVASKDMRRHDWEILAVYHSHPISAPVPSNKDREQNYLGDVIHFIVGLNDPAPEVRAWWLACEDYREADWLAT